MGTKVIGLWIERKKKESDFELHFIYELYFINTCHRDANVEMDVTRMDKIRNDYIRGKSKSSSSDREDKKL